MAIFGEHKYTSITVKVNQLCNATQNDEREDALELYLGDLILLIKLQPGPGPVEASRAIRKKIKYSELIDDQLRALQVLELLVLNSGPKIGPSIARDDKLLDVLKGIINGSGKTGENQSYPPQVQKRVQELSLGWKYELQDLDGYGYMAQLYKNIPKSKSSRRQEKERPPRRAENVFEDQEDKFTTQRSPRPQRLYTPEPTTPKVPPPRPNTSSPYNFGSKPSSDSRKLRKKKKKRRFGGSKYADPDYKIPQINYKVEAPKIRSVIADCHTHTTALNNRIISIPGDLPMEDDICQKEFETCRKIRRKVLRYLQFVGAGDISEKNSLVAAMDEEFLGSLIDANEKLITVFQKFDRASGNTVENLESYGNDDESSSGESYYTDDDSEEEEEEEEEEESTSDALNRQLTSTKLQERRAPPPIPQKPTNLQRLATNETMTTVNTLESDPFGDSKVVSKGAYE